MVYGEGVALHGRLYPTRIGELLTVYLSAQAVLRSSFENADGLLGCEEAFVAEHIDVERQLLLADGRNHLVHNHVDILALPANVFSPDGMSTQEGGNDLDGCGLLDATNDAQHLQLVGGIQTVAALDFYGTRSLQQDFANATHGLLVEFFLRGVVQAVGRVQDAPTPLGNLGIAETAYLIDKLAFAAAGVDQVCMRVAERRKHSTAASIDDHLHLGRNGIVGHRAIVADAAVIEHQPGIRHRVVFGHFGTTQQRLRRLLYAGK